MSEQVDRETELASSFANIARQLQSQESPEQTWQRIVDLAVEILPEVEHAGISLVHRGGRIDSPASSDDVARAIDAIQDEAGEGPCIDAIRDKHVFVSPDLAKENRWPTFSSRTVEETGVRSMLSFQLFVQEETLGALNLFAHPVDAFDERSEALGSVLAAHAAVAMSAAQELEHAEQMEDALENSREIGTAVGIMMVQAQVGREEAFRRLAAASMRLNIKLRDLAARMVSTEDENYRNQS